jgi:hypothetical protein
MVRPVTTVGKFNALGDTGVLLLVPRWTAALVDEPFIGPPEVRAARMAALREAFARTARILQEPG